MAVYTIEWKYSLGGAKQPAIVEGVESDSQTYLKGTPVVFDASNPGRKIATDSVAALSGIVQADGTNVTSGHAVQAVIVPTALDVFSATIAAAGTNGTAEHDLATGAVDAFSWIASAESGETAKYTVDTSDTTNEWITVIGLDPRDASGTSGGRVLFRLLGPGDQIKGIGTTSSIVFAVA
jgi:hypothetical protein